MVGRTLANEQESASTRTLGTPSTMKSRRRSRDWHAQVHAVATLQRLQSPVTTGNAVQRRNPRAAAGSRPAHSFPPAATTATFGSTQFRSTRNPRNNTTKRIQTFLFQSYGEQPQRNPSVAMKEALIAFAVFGEGNRSVGSNAEYVEILSGFEEILRRLLPEADWLRGH